MDTPHDSPCGTPQTPAEIPRAGGKGVERAFPGDLQVYARAFREHWDMSNTERREIIDTCLACIRDPAVSYTRKVGAARVLIQADMANISRERIASQEKTTQDRTQVDAMMALLRTLSPQERAQLNALTLRGQNASEQTSPPPGGFITGQMYQEGVQPPGAATTFQNQSAGMTEPPVPATENQNPPASLTEPSTPAPPTE